MVYAMTLTLTDLYQLKNFHVRKNVLHGYPSRRRSLVGDAKFETVKNKEAKETWILEQRKKTEDEELSEEEFPQIAHNTIGSSRQGSVWPRPCLVPDAASHTDEP
ncbi:hypothetical protein TNCV_1397101 [Trichonephila clavipes]|nr:hypothetical protein TNCV_1397101 [Trichonephila clavipes]